MSTVRATRWAACRCWKTATCCSTSRARSSNTSSHATATERSGPRWIRPCSRAILQWLHYCEGMVMPPINTIVVHTLLLPPERRNAEILGQAKRLLTKTLEPLNEALAGRDYMLGELSGVDFMLGHACYMARRLGCMPEDMTHLHAYVKRLEARPAFQKGIQT